MKRISAVLLAFVFAASLGTACKSGATCESAMEHAMTIMPKEMTEAMKPEQLAELKTKGIKDCKEEKTPQAELDCAVKAKDLEALTACKGKK